MFSVGTNFGNGENMINAGVSFKFGPKGKSQVRPGSTQEITEQRATVARQDDQLRKQDSEIKELKAMVQQLMADSKGALPLSYGAMVAPVGIEPTTSRSQIYEVNLTSCHAIAYY